MGKNDAASLRQQFGSVVRSRRNQLGISQEMLADRAGLHRTYVSDVERGARNPSLASIDRLAHALEISIASLFFVPTASGPLANPHSQTVDILMVEDNPADVTLTLRAFKKARLSNQIHVVRDGEEALAYVFCTGRYASRRMECSPKVILLDLVLPKVDGLEVLRRLKNDERTRLIPVVVLTSSEQSRDIDECRRLGANAYIAKPVDFVRFSQVTPQLSFSWTLLKLTESAHA